MKLFTCRLLYSLEKRYRCLYIQSRAAAFKYTEGCEYLEIHECRPSAPEPSLGALVSIKKDQGSLLHLQAAEKQNTIVGNNSGRYASTASGRLSFGSVGSVKL